LKPRIDYAKVDPEAAKPLYALDAYLRHSGLEPSLRELVKMRASQINGCAYCIDMHSKDARAAGETEQRLYALAWTEAVTRVSEGHVPDDVYELARQQFSEKELVSLTLAVAAINTWNRLAISFRAVPGAYQPAAKAQSQTHSA